jgi:tetratricopeptide (TPR) repeat protein/TolB-like protein
MVSSLVRELLRRRVPQVLGVYLAVGWGILEFSDWLVNRYLLSPHILDFSLLTWATMIPTVSMLAWFHGAPGPDRWTKAEKIGIPANLVAAAILLVSVFGGKDLGAATTSLSFEDETGRTIERTVPKNEFIKSVAVYFFDNTSADTTIDWLRYAIPWTLKYDLEQDLFVDVRSSDLTLRRLRERGFPEGLDVPLTLKREIATNLHLGHFLTGSVAEEDGRIVVTTSLYETRRGKLVAARTFFADDLFGLIDEISVQLKHDLSVPAHYIEQATDLPVSEILTSSLPAYRHFVDGGYAAVVELDWERASAHLEDAIAVDSQFAIAHLVLFGTRLQLNQTEAAQDAIETVMGLIYKLPERSQLSARTAYYFLTGDMDRALTAAEMHAELYPRDIEAQLTLADYYESKGDRQQATGALLRVLELDPGRVEVLLRIGELYKAEGDFDAALEYLQRYATEMPTDPTSFIALGDLYNLTAELAEAAVQYEKALVADPSNVRARVRLAEVDAGLGNFDRALPGFEEALAACVTPEQRALVYGALQSYHEWRGQPRVALDYMHLRLAEIEEFQGPFQAVQQRLQNLRLYVKAGAADVALDSLASLASQLSPPFDLLLPWGKVGVYLQLENADSVEAALEGLERFIEGFAFEAMRPYVTYLEGRVLEIRGNCEGAIPKFEGAVSQHFALGANVDLGRCYRTLGRLEDAERQLQRALEVRPADPTANYEIALVYAERGDRDLALEHLQTALDTWADAEPVYKPARKAREKLTELSGG